MTTYNTNKGSLISLIIGAPLGIVALFVSVLLLLDMNPNENIIFLMIPVFFCSQALLIAFLLVLWRSGRTAAANLVKGQHLPWVVVKYSATISLVMGGVFSCIFIACWSLFSMSYLSVVFIFSGTLMFVKLFLSIVFIFAGTFVVSFMIGLLVCYVIRWQISRDQASLTDLEIR